MHISITLAWRRSHPIKGQKADLSEIISNASNAIEKKGDRYYTCMDTYGSRIFLGSTYESCIVTLWDFFKDQGLAIKQKKGILYELEAIGILNKKA